MTTKPEFIDAAARNRANPTTFHIPSMGEIEAVVPGQHIKIGLEEEGRGGERFWLLLTETTGQGEDQRLTGTVDNDLVVFSEFPLGHVFTVEPRHVMDVLA